MKKNEPIPKHPIDASCRALEEEISVTYNPKNWEALKAQLKNNPPATQAKSDNNINTTGASKWIIPTMGSILLVAVISIIGWRNIDTPMNTVPVLSEAKQFNIPPHVIKEDTISNTINEFERSYENAKGNVPLEDDVIWKTEVEKIRSIRLPESVVSQKNRIPQKLDLKIQKTSDKDKFLFW